MLEFQDEIDRETTSLWGIDPVVDKDGKAKIESVLTEQLAVQIDKDCLSCSLDKYRPMIKKAFKMACI
jgi:hypothetical protein